MNINDFNPREIDAFRYFLREIDVLDAQYEVSVEADGGFTGDFSTPAHHAPFERHQNILFDHVAAEYLVDRDTIELMYVCYLNGDLSI